MSKRAFQIAIWACVGFIILAFGLLIFSSQFSLRFSDYLSRVGYHYLLVVSIPIASLIASAIRYQMDSTRENAARYTIYAVIISIILFAFAGSINFFTSNWIDEQRLFEYKHSDKEIIRQFNSSTQDTRIVEISPTLLRLQFVHTVDINELSEDDWKKLSHKEGYIAW